MQTMILSKNDLKFYMQADYMMNRGKFKRSFKDIIKEILVPDYICLFLSKLRKAEFYHNRGGYSFGRILNAFRLHKLSIKLGFSIPCNVFEYGLVIPHYGTIVVGEGNKIGAYCVLHTSTCITAGKKRIGRGLYVSTGAKIIHDIELGEGITIGANSILNKDCVQNNKMLAGVPAKIIKPIDIWFIRDGEEFTRRYRECENLKKIMKV